MAVLGLITPAAGPSFSLAEPHTAFRGFAHRVSGIPTGPGDEVRSRSLDTPRRLSVQELATPEHDTGIRPRWYVLVTSATGNSVFATMGPYPSENGAKHAADGARVVHYRVGQVRSRNSGLLALAVARPGEVFHDLETRTAVR